MKINIKKITELSNNERIKILRKLSISPIQLRDNHYHNYRSIDSFKSQKEMKKVIKLIADKLGIVKEYNNINLDFAFEYSYTKLKESINKIYTNRSSKFTSFIKLLTCIEDVIYHAVPIEKHKDIYEGTIRESKQLKNVYILLGAFQDELIIYPVEVIVKELIGNIGSLHMIITIGEIKKSDIIPTPGDKLTHVGTSDTYILTNIINRINNGDFLKYIPDKLLCKNQLPLKQNALIREKKRIKNYKRNWNNI